MSERLLEPLVHVDRAWVIRRGWQKWAGGEQGAQIGATWSGGGSTASNGEQHAADIGSFEARGDDDRVDLYHYLLAMLLAFQARVKGEHQCE